MLPLTRSRNRARFFGTPFSPEALFAGGTVAGAWYDPSDLTTLFTTSAGTTQCAMPGGGAAVSVGRMLDKSGNGNHAIAFNNTTARPELRARVNSVEYSEQLDNAYWTKDAFTVANTTATTDPLGGTTADVCTPTATNAAHRIYRGGTSQVTASSCIYTLSVKANGYTKIGIRESTTSGAGAAFDLAGSGSVIGAFNAWGSTVSDMSISSQGNGWFRIAFTISSASATAQSLGIHALSPSYSAGSTIFEVWNANGTDGYYIWGADLRPANIGANVPAYQRIADANTYDTSGFPLYLRFDGIDDSMYTPANLNLSGTDKIAVFAGVRKLSAALGFFAELSANTSANNGSFYVVANNGTNDYGISLRGTAQATYQPVTYTAPISNVLAVSYDIAGAAISDEIVPRVNGVVEQDNPSGANAGTGNFGTYPLYIGARNNASGWLNGHLYSLLVVGSAVSAGNISATEQWVAGKTGIQI